MAFIVAFIVALLVVPIWMDIERNGSDNILHKSVQDILRFRWVLLLQDFFRSLVSRSVDALKTSIALSASLVLGVYILYYLVRYLLVVFFR